MTTKTWRKSLHKRRKWEKMAFRKKLIYYFRPFAQLIFSTWSEPLPCPTAFKILITGFVVGIAILPFMMIVGAVFTLYLEVQYLLNRHFGYQYSNSYDLLSYSNEAVHGVPTNPKMNYFLLLYFEKLRILVFGLCSCVDYFRLATQVLAI